MTTDVEVKKSPNTLLRLLKSEQGTV